MFSDIPKIDAVVLRRVPGTTGNISWQELPVKAVILGEYAKLSPEGSPVAGTEKTVLVYSAELPEPGSRIILNNENRIIRSIRTIRDVSCRIIAYKCEC